MFIKKGFLDRLGFFISHGLFIGKGLTPSGDGVNLSGWYQWIMTGDGNEIVVLDGGGSGYENKGTGVIDQPIGNIQVLTLDGNSSYVELPSDVYENITTELRIVAQFNLDGGSSSRVLSSRSATGFELVVNSDESLRLRLSDGTTTQTPILLSEGASNVDLCVDIKADLINGALDYNINGIDYSMSITPMGSLANSYMNIGKFATLSASGIVSNVTLYNSITSNTPLCSYYFQEGQGVNIYDSSGSGNNGILIGSNQAIAWGTKSDIAYPALLRWGYTQFESDTIAGQYIYAIYDINGLPTSQAETGYSIINEIPPNAGFSNTGNTINWVNGDTGLQAIADQYSIPYILSYDQMLAIDFSVIDEADLRVTFENNVFTDWAAQPYESEPLKDVNGEILYDVNGEKLYSLKEF